MREAQLLGETKESGKRWVALGCTCLLVLVRDMQCTGSLNAFGAFSVYYASYYYQSYPDVEIVRNCFFVVFPAICVIEGLAFGTLHTAVTVFIYQRIGFKPALLSSGCCLSFAYVSIFIIPNPYLFALVYSFCMGYGSGGCWYLCILECWKHFSPRRKGRVMGTASACYGFGPTIWTLLFAFCSNPDNKPATIQVHEGAIEYNLFAEDVASRVPWVSAAFGLTCAAIFVCSIAVFPTDSEKRGSVVESVASHLSDIRSNYSTCPDLKAAIRSWPFWSLTINLFCGIFFGLFIVNAYKDYGLTRYSNDQQMSSIGGFAAALGACGRVLFSVAMDHFSFRAVFGVNTVLQLVACASITHAIEASVYLYGACVAIGFCMFSGVFAVFIMESSRVFGNRYVTGRVGPSAMSLISQSFTLASIGTVAMHALLGKVATSQAQGYDACFYLMTGLTAISLVLTLTAPKAYT